jgi:thiol:disulfide interchange protein DsbC
MHKPFATAIMLALTALLVFGSHALAEEEQVAPPGLTAEQATEAIMKLIPDIRVISIEPAIIPGLWEVAFESKGKKGVVYIDSTRSYLVVGSVIGLGTGMNYTKQKFESINTVDFSSIPLEDSLVLGNPKAEYKVVVFDDPD